MSYILEALKKVEQKREQEDVSKPPTFLSELGQEHKKPLVWPYILAAALIVNAGLALRLFGPWWAHEKELASISPSAVEPRAMPVLREKEAQDRPPLAKTAVNERPHVRDAKAVQVPGDRQKGASTQEKPGMGQREASAAPSPPPLVQKASAAPETSGEVQARVEKAPPAFAAKVVSPGELPSSIRASLPEFKVSGHAYGPDPQTRVVRVNEKILQEGQELSPGLKVEEIVPDGIIFGYSGYHFRIGVK